MLLQLSSSRGQPRTASRRSRCGSTSSSTILRDRYGLYIDQLPDGDGFGPAIVTDHAALRENRAAFIARLREIGFYSDLSDAYLTQTITPRYIIKASSGAGA